MGTLWGGEGLWIMYKVRKVFVATWGGGETKCPNQGGKFGWELGKKGKIYTRGKRRRSEGGKNLLGSDYRNPDHSDVERRNGKKTQSEEREDRKRWRVQISD